MKRSSLVAVIVVALVVVGIVIYLARQRPEEFDVARPGGTPASSQPVSSATTAPAASAPAATSVSALASCIGPASDSQSQIAALHTQHQYAHSLVEKNHFETALPALRNIAVSDPGYPGINLDISETLLKAKHLPEANDAINLQLEISECLSKLPDSDVQAYCKAQWTSAPEGGCSAELAKIDDAAARQAKLVKAELAKSPAPSMIARTPAPQPAKPAVPAPAKVAPPPSAAASEAAVPKPVPLPPPVMLKADQASEHVGERATVCGIVVSKTASQANGKPTFINLDHPFPNPTFTVVVFESDAPQAGDLPASGNLCVTGTIALYRGTPQIVVHDAKSWSR
jgi:hypothetical protein